jgi:hypothetical protein
VTINGRPLSRVIIDQHYKEKHAESINDQLILSLIQRIDGNKFQIEEEDGPLQYFRAHTVNSESKWFRLVLLISTESDFLGVINTYRIDGRPR